MARARTVLAGAAVALGAAALPSLTAGAAEGGDLTAPVADEAFERDLPTGFQYAAPAVADIDGDGTADIVVAGQDGVLRVSRADGSTIWERAVVPPDAHGPVAIESSPTIADLNGDGRPEIVVGAGSFYVYEQHGGLVTFDASGNVVWAFATADTFNFWTMAPAADGWREPVHGATAVGDVNGDGRPDVVFGAMDNRVHALDGATGAPLPGWVSPDGTPGVWLDDSMWSSVALADVDRDGRGEVFAGVAATPGGSISHAGGVMVRLDLEASGLSMPWVRAVSEPVNSSPALADLDGDGALDVVFGTGFENGTADTNRVFAVRTDSGDDLAGWPRDTNGATFSSPAIGDLDGDARPDVTIGTFPRDGGPGLVYAWRGDGSLLWAREPNQVVVQTGVAEPSSVIVASPVIADLDGDGGNDITIGTGWATFTLDGATGNRIWAPLDKGHTYQNTATVARFGPNQWMVVTASIQGRVAAYRIPAPGTVPPWPTFRGGTAHTGRAIDSGAPACSGPPPGEPLAPAGGRFHPVSPTRLLDTRTGAGVSRAGIVPPGCTIAVTVTGVNGVPATGVDAVALNVTVAGAAAGGYLTVHPCGQAPPNTSNLNYAAGQTIPNLVEVQVGAAGQVCFTTLAAVHVIADVAGWFGPAGGASLHGLTPVRLLDTRLTGGPVGAGTPLPVTVAGVAGLPAAGVGAVAVNVTVTDPAGDGYATVWPCGPQPAVSNVNFTAGATAANAALVPVAPDGTICVAASTPAHLVVDVAGWFPATGGDATFGPRPPGRVADTRTGHGVRAGALGPGEVLELAAGEDRAVTWNVTATEATSDGYLTLWPCGEARPDASNVNYTPGRTTPNLVTVAAGANGKVCAAAYAPVHVIVDDFGGWR